MWVGRGLGRGGREERLEGWHEGAWHLHLCVCKVGTGQGTMHTPPPHGFRGRPFWVLGVSCSYFFEGNVFI